MDRLYVINPSWKELVSLQRMLARNPSAMGFIFISNKDMNVMPNWRKLANHRIAVWHMHKPSDYSVSEFFYALDKMQNNQDTK